MNTNLNFNIPMYSLYSMLLFFFLKRLKEAGDTEKTGVTVREREKREKVPNLYIRCIVSVLRHEMGVKKPSATVWNPD